MSTALVCPNCHQGLLQGSAFCAHCGHRLSAAPDRAAAPAGWPPSERKYLSILFADLQRSTELTAIMDPEEALSRLEPALEAMRTAVRRHGGIVSKELGDGLIALFGAPESDANHAVMACRAALDLTRRIARLDDRGLQVRVGVHSGDVVVRVVAGDYSQVYEASGPAVALASRLESAAEPGEILASENCRWLAEGLISFEAGGRRPLRGFPELLPIFKVTGFTGLSRWRVRAARGLARFVGRSNELASLRSAAEEAATGVGRIVSILGEPGIGKSRLVHEFLAGTDWQVIDVECSPTNNAIPYATLKNLLLSLGRAFGHREFTIDDYLGDDRSAFPVVWRAAIDAILDRPIADLEWPGLGPRLRERAVIDAWRRLVERVAARRRTVLLIEDLHWIDSASSAAIEALLSPAAAVPLLVLLTTRDEAAVPWQSRPGVLRLRLLPLPPAAAIAFLDALLGQAASLADLKRRILDHTGRVPLFIEEVVRRLVDTGTLVGDWGGLALGGPIERLGVPPTIQGVIAGRIDRLAGPEKSLLRAVSAIGPRAEFTLLQAVAEMPEPALRRAVAALGEAELLIEVARGVRPAYVFPHDLVREVAYESMLGPERQRLHGRILAGIAAASEGRTEEAAEILAHHAVLAYAWAEAGDYALLAARKCMARSVLNDAARYFEVAIDAIDRLPASIGRDRQAIDLRIEARQVIPAIGRVERWFLHAGEAEARAAAIGDAGRQVAALVNRAGALNFYSVPRQAIPVNETAVRQAEAFGDGGWLSIAEYGLGQACLTAGRYRQAEQVLARAGARLGEPDLEIPVGTTRTRHLALCHMMKSVAHVALGELDAAETWQARATEIAAIARRPYDVIAADYGRGVFLLACGRFAAAFTALNEALRLGRRHDVKQFIPIVATQLGNLYLQQDDTASAYDTLVEAKREAEELGHLLSVLRASLYLGLALARRERPAEALRAIRATREQAVRDGFDGLGAEALFCEAAVLAAADPPDRRQSNQCLDEAVSVASRLDAVPQVAAARALLGENLAHQGDVSSAVAELRRAVDLFAAMKLTRQRDRASAALEKLLCVPTYSSGEGGRLWQSP